MSSVGHWYQGFNAGGDGDSTPSTTATRPTAPSSYTPPAGTSVSTSSGLVSALQSSTPTTIIVENGVYTNGSRVAVGAAHQVYARSLLGAEIQFGLESGQFSNTTGLLLRGLKFDLTDSTKTLLGSILRIWASNAAGWQLKDCTFHGTDSINDAVGGLGNANLEGLVIQRCEARNFHQNGFKIDSNSTTYVPTTPPVLQDIYTENCVFKTNPGGSNGTSEAGLWLGCKATLNRLWCHQVPGYGVAGAHGGTFAWQGLWLGTNVRDMTITDVLVTGEIAFGTYAFGPINSDNASTVLCQRFETDSSDGLNVGFHIEWNNPTAAHNPNAQNIITENSRFDSLCVGWDADQGTVHSTCRSTVFVNQQAYAINNYTPGANMLYDTAGNDYTGAAGTIGTGHAPDYACWGV